MEQQEQRWRPTRRQALWTVGIAGVLTVAVFIGYRYDITLWDWLKLLVVPAVIAGGGLWFNRQQREREIEIAVRRVQDEALQAYLDQIGSLLLNKDKPLRQSKEGDDMRAVARARTLTVLGRVGGDYKGTVLQFLYESGLISWNPPTPIHVSSIVDLRKANLVRANLSKAYLERANLRGADLTEAMLWGSILSGANLFRADLRGAILRRADLRDAILYWADLTGANLLNAKVTTEQLLQTSPITSQRPP